MPITHIDFSELSERCELANYFADFLANCLAISSLSERIRMTDALAPIVQNVGDACRLPVSAHWFRHKLLNNLVRVNPDLILVAEIGGHKKLKTTKRYTLTLAGEKEQFYGAGFV